MSLKRKHVCIIAYSQRFEDIKDQVNGVFKELGYGMKHILISEETQKKKNAKLKGIKRSLSKDTKCVVLFYLYDKLQHSDLGIMKMFLGNSLRTTPKIFFFYNDLAQDYDDDSARIRYDAPNLFYFFGQKKKVVEFNYVKMLCDLIVENSEMSVVDIHYKILTEITDPEDCFEDLCMFCSLTSKLIFNKKMLLDYFCVAKENVVDVANFSGDNYVMDRLDDEASATVTQMSRDALCGEFNGIEDIRGYLELVEDDPTKMKKLFFYLIYSHTDDRGEASTVDVEGIFTKILEKETFNKKMTANFYVKALELLSDVIGGSNSHVVKTLKLLYVLYTSCPYGIDMDKIIKVSEVVFDKIKGYLTNIVTVFKTSNETDKQLYRDIIYLVAKIVYQLVTVSKWNLGPLAFAFQTLTFIYDNITDEEVSQMLSVPLSITGVKAVGMNIFKVLRNKASNCLNGWSEDQLKAIAALEVGPSEVPHFKDFCFVIKNDDYGDSGGDSALNDMSLSAIQEFFGAKMAVNVFSNCEFDELRSKISFWRAEVSQTLNRLFVFVMSRGDDYNIKTVDGKLFPKTAFLKEISINSGNLRQGRPKIIVLQLRDRVQSSKQATYTEEEENTNTDLKNFFIINSSWSPGVVEKDQKSYIERLIQRFGQSPPNPSLVNACIGIQAEIKDSWKGKRDKDKINQKASFEDHCFKETRVFW